jgi:hypothetical protein
MDRFSPGTGAVDDTRFLLISGFYGRFRRNLHESQGPAERFLLRFRLLLARFGFYWRSAADEARRRKLRRPRSHGYESQHTEALQNAAPDRWTTTTRAIVEKSEKAEKAGSFPGFSQLSQSARLRKLEVLKAMRLEQ